MFWWLFPAVLVGGLLFLGIYTFAGNVVDEELERTLVRPDLYVREYEGGDMFRQVISSHMETSTTLATPLNMRGWEHVNNADYHPQSGGIVVRIKVCQYCHQSWEGSPCPGCGGRIPKIIAEESE